MCCLKGAVTTQFCGWIRTLPLFAGATSDSEYDKNNGSAQLQREFANSDLVDGKVIPFTHIKDKGYRTSQELFREGGQLTLQPTFKRSDRKFTRNETLSSSQLASHRSGNERAVRVAKSAGYLFNGASAKSWENIDDVWLANGFMVNFKYCSVFGEDD